jgi:magnesium-transporting ATPase (P-type)
MKNKKILKKFVKSFKAPIIFTIFMFLIVSLFVTFVNVSLNVHYLTYLIIPLFLFSLIFGFYGEYKDFINRELNSRFFTIRLYDVNNVVIARFRRVKALNIEEAYQKILKHPSFNNWDGEEER